MKWFKAWSMTLIALAAVGCGGVKTADLSPDRLPEPFEVAQDMHDEPSSRVARYVVDGEGMLNYGGGHHALVRDPKPIGRLTDAERLELWRIIHRHGLMAASGAMFKSADQTLYRAKLTAAGQSHRFRAVDDEVAGLSALNDALYRMYSERRYEDVIRPIESEIERHEGNVPRQ